MRIEVAFALLLLVSPYSSAAPLAEIEFGGSRLRVNVPEGWRLQKHVLGTALDLRVIPRDKGDFRILMTVLPLGDPSMKTASNLKAFVESAGQRQLPSATQDQLVVSELKSDEGIGYLYHLTDRKPESGPGDYREATQGAIVRGPYIVSVTILTHTDDTTTLPQALDLLKSLRIIAAAQ